MSHLILLPNEILVSILTFLIFPLHHRITVKQLSQCALVNRALYAASTPLLWQHPICPEPAWALGKKALSLLSCLRSSPRPAYLGQYIRRLDLHGSDIMKQVVPFMSCMPLLHNLRLSAPSDPVSHPCHSIYPILYDILPHCPRLERLLLSNFEISNSTLVNISQWCSQIHDLELHNCAGFTTDSLTTLLTDYRTCLTSLTLLVNDGWKAHLGRTLDLSQLQQLTSLSVYRCLAIDNDFLCRPLAPHLTTFRITQCNVDLGHTPELFLRFLRAHPLLRSLVLSHCRLDNRVLDGLTPAVIPNLNYLDLSYNGHPISSQAVRQMIKRCVSLSQVVLQECDLPARCFPERTAPWSVKIDALGSDAITAIRQSDLIFTAVDDVFQEGEEDYYTDEDEEEEDGSSNED